MYIYILLLLLQCSITSNCLSRLKQERFYENLHIKALPQQHKYLIFFNFTSLYPPPPSERSPGPLHYGLFPRALGEILEKHRVQELHLSLTQSNWRYAVWGRGLSRSVAPVGAQLVAWLGQERANASRTMGKDVTAQWRDLVHSLGGMISSSLHEMKETNTVAPSDTFRPWGLLPASAALLQGAIPREAVCTNNLTPFRKMLPCPEEGLSQLLLPKSLFNNLYHSLAMHIYYTQEEGEQLAVRLELYLSTVFDTRKWQKRGFSLSDLFGSGVSSLCPLADREGSGLALDFTELKWPHLLQAKSHKFVFSSSPLRSAPFYKLLHSSRSVDPKLKWLSPQTEDQFLTQEVLLVDRYTYSSGLEDGQMCSEIRNQLNASLLFTHLETVPWYFRVFTHTINTRLTLQNGQELSADLSDYTRLHKLQLARDKAQPLMLEMVHALPPKATLKICAYFQRATLHWTEYPPDAHHGFYVPPVVLRPSSFSRGISHLYSDDWSPVTEAELIYSRPLLISLATPDFSMPYNVLCLVCTAVGIGFALIYRLSTQPVNIGLDMESEGEGIVKRIFKMFRKTKIE